MSDLEYIETNNIDMVGVDISRKGAIISWLTNELSDPITVLTKEGNTRIIPICMAKDRGLGRWYAGEDAINRAGIDGAIRVDDLYENAREKKSIKVEDREYAFEELFATYLRRILEDNGIETAKLKKLVVSVPEVDYRCVELFSSLNNKLRLSKDVFSLIDHKESFIYYTLNQNQNIFVHDVALYEYVNNRIYSYILNRNTQTKPQVIDIAVDKIDLQGDKDKEFCELIERSVAGRIVTSVFLVGDGFDPDWMNDSVNILCKGRRVFLGDNLYSKGACFAGKIKLGKFPWNYVYIGDHEMKMNLSLKVNDRNDMTFVTLVDAGENWYETGREYEVILDGTPEFECWIQSPETRRAKIHMIELKGLPKRDNRTTRLRITASPISDTQVSLKIRDLGFGDIAPSSGKVWEYVVNMDSEVDNG